MKDQKRCKSIVTFRTLIQWSFCAWVVVIGIRFGIFVRHFETGGATAFVSRPPGVEGFLPIGALASLKSWLATGVINPLHPAAVVIFLTIVAHEPSGQEILLLLALPGWYPF